MTCRKPTPLTIQNLLDLFQQAAKDSPLGKDTCVYINIAPGVDYQIPKVNLEVDQDGAILVIDANDNYSDFWSG